MRPTSAADEVDVIVVGLGGSGSAAAYWAARGGAKVIGLEQFRLGHARGASHDHGHVFRTIHGCAAQVMFAREAHASWTEVSAEAGEDLLVPTGTLELFPGAGPELERHVHALEACGVAHEQLDVAGIAARWPQFALGPRARGLFERKGGLVTTARAAAAHQRLACEYGADLRDTLGGLEAVEVADGEVSVRSGGRTMRARRLIVCAGAWTNAVLAPLGTRLALAVTREQVLYFAPCDAEAFSVERFPAWIWHGERRVYGLPAFGEPAVKVAEEFTGEQIEPESRAFAPDEDNRARVHDFVDRTFPAAFGGEHLTKTLLYAASALHRPMLGVLPAHPEVAVYAGSGEGFGLATQVGRMLAELTPEHGVAGELFPLATEPQTAMVPSNT